MTAELSAVSVIGLGKLGACMAALFAQHQLEVIGVDVNPESIELVNAGRAPVHEPNLDALIHGNSDRIKATNSIAEAVAGTSASFVIVPTPSQEDGSFSHDLVVKVCQEIGAALQSKEQYHLVVITSTVMPGATGGEIREALEQASGKSCGAGFGLCYSPEFIALGSVISDMLNPDFVLIGESDRMAGECLVEIYNRMYFGQQRFARMNFVNAELTKIAVNTYVTTKISYANMLAQICSALPDANSDVVSAAVGLDRRIGGAYLKGALPFGGPCFPRDNKAFARLADTIGVNARLAVATDEQNQLQLDFLLQLVANTAKAKAKVGVLGLAYKAGTSVIEGSPSVDLVRELSAQGFEVLAFDPQANDNAKEAFQSLDLTDKVVIAESSEQIIADCDLIILAQPWEDFAEFDHENFEQREQPVTVIDCWRQRTDLQTANNVNYIALGMGPSSAN